HGLIQSHRNPDFRRRGIAGTSSEIYFPKRGAIMTIQLKQVSKTFGSFQALQSIDLNIADGEFVAILGPSGCGKTTLLRMLAGFEQPTSGEIAIGGSVVASSRSSLPPEKRRVGMVFQNFALWPHMNIYEHVRFPIRTHKETPRA